MRKRTIKRLKRGNRHVLHSNWLSWSNASNAFSNLVLCFHSVSFIKYVSYVSKIVLFNLMTLLRKLYLYEWAYYLLFKSQCFTPICYIVIITCLYLDWQACFISLVTPIFYYIYCITLQFMEILFQLQLVYLHYITTQ